MANGRFRAGFNVKLLVILVVSVAVLGAGAYFGRKYRQKAMAQQAFREGTAAFEKQDWETARTMLGRYLWRYPDDKDVLQKFAMAQLSTRPLPAANVAQAMTAYRRLLRDVSKPQEELSPADLAIRELATTQLAAIYQYFGDLNELGQLAKQRKQVAPDDVRVPLWQAQALGFQNKREEAQRELEALVERIEPDPTKHSEFIEACRLLAGLQSEARTPESRETALAWLERAVKYDPDSAAARTQRAMFYLTAERDLTSGNQQGAREDLQDAALRESKDPLVLLALCEGWLRLGEFDRAEAALAEMKALPPDAVRPDFLAADDWILVQFTQAAQLALMRGAAERGVMLANEALGQLKERRQLERALPIAIELLVEGKELAKAGDCLIQLKDFNKGAGTSPDREEDLAYLEAIIARGQDKPYRVIELLAPLADRARRGDLVRRLLADAYVQTGQAGRALVLFEGRTSPAAAELPTLVRLTRTQMRAGAWQQALENARKAEGLKPDDLDLRLLRIQAQLATMQGGARPAEYQTIVDELAQIRAARPDDVGVWILSAAVMQAQDKPEAAEAVLVEALALKAERPAAALQLAQLYAATQRGAQALDVLRKATEQYPALAAAWLALADQLAENKQVDEARAVLKQAAERVTAPDERRRVGVSSALFEAQYGDRRAAEGMLETLANENAEELTARNLLVLMLAEDIREIARSTRAIADKAAAAEAPLRQAGALIGAIKAAEGETGLTWRIRQAELNLAESGFAKEEARLKKQKEAIDLLQYCITADPRWATPALLLGGHYTQLSDFVAAEKIYSAALKAAPNSVIADRLLTVLQRQRRYDEARQLLDQIRETTAAQALAARRATLAAEAGDYKTAVAELERRVSGKSRSVDDLVFLARVTFLEKGELTRALALLDEAEMAAPDAITVPAARAAILRAAKRNDEARQVLDKFVARNDTFDARLLRGAFLAAAGQPDLAEQDYVRLLELSDTGGGHEVLGEFYATTGRLERAIEVWRAGLALEKGKDNQRLKRGIVKALVALARDAGQTDKLPEAKQRLAELTDQISNDVDLLWLQALVDSMEGTADGRARALNLARGALQLPVKVEPYLGLARLALGLENPGLARELLQRALVSYPNETALLLTLAQLDISTGSPQDALPRIERVLASDERNAAAYILLINAARTRDERGALRNPARLEQARKKLRDETTKDPTARGLVLALAQAELALDNYAGAVEQARAVLSTDPGNTTAYETLFDAGLRPPPNRAAIDAARSTLLSQVEKTPDNEALRLLAARIAISLGEPDAAIQQLTAFRQSVVGQRSVPAALLLEQLYRGQNNWAAADEVIKVAEQLSPGAAPVVRARLLWLGGQQKFDEVAKRAAGEARPEVLLLAAQVLSGSNKPEQRKAALAMFEKLQAQSGLFVPAQLGIALTSYQLGDLDRAEQAFRAAIERDPANAEALNNLAWILATDRKQYEDALPLARRAVERNPGDANMRDTLGYVLMFVPDKLAESRAQLEQAVALAPPTGEVRARSLYHLAKVCVLLKDLAPVPKLLEDAAAAAGDAAQIFSPEERADIQKLRDAARGAQ